MTAADFQQPRNPFARLYDALIDPMRCERTMALVLAGYAAAWTLYGAIAKSSQDLNQDMGEVVAWSHQIVLGSPKHPPLAAWLVRAWFDVMPATDWAYYLFAVALATVALWIAWRVAARYLPADKRVVGIALLTLVPFYNFHALKFNVNTVLIPFWAATTWWFLRSLDTRRAGWAALAGAGAAAAMLGKYWSIFLLAGLGVAALADPRRGAYFRSPAPWLTIAVGAVLIAPHVVWIMTHDFELFRYALEAHPATLAGAVYYAAAFLGGTVAYIAAPMALNLIATRPSKAAILDSIWPPAGERRTVLVALAAPILLAVLVSIPLEVGIDALWAMPALTLLPVALLSSPLVSVPRLAAVRLLALTIVFPVLMAAVSPVIALVIHREGVPNHASHYALIARAVERAWNGRTDKPLRIVGGDAAMVNGTEFYFANPPATLDINNPPDTPWVHDDRIKRDGIAIVCPVPQTHCVQTMNNYAARFAGAQAEDVELARRYFGTSDKPVEYRILTIPPQ